MAEIKGKITLNTETAIAFIEFPERAAAVLLRDARFDAGDGGTVPGQVGTFCGIPVRLRGAKP